MNYWQKRSEMQLLIPFSENKFMFIWQQLIKMEYTLNCVT